MLSFLVDLLWPQVCPLCDRELRADRVHPECLARVPRARARDGDGVVACFEDGPAWFRLLHRWKYGGERGLAATVADCMAPGVVSMPRGAVLVPLPDDPARRLERGYSPVGDLARALAARTKMPVDPRLLARARATASQTSCRDDGERMANIRGAFRVGDLSRWPPTRPVVLIEDQVTSGATVAEAARLLGARGASVKVWCAARAARAPRRLDAGRGRH